MSLRYLQRREAEVHIGCKKEENSEVQRAGQEGPDSPAYQGIGLLVARKLEVPDVKYKNLFRNLADVCSPPGAVGQATG